MMFYTRPDICTKDRTESMMMGIFQTNSITIRQEMNDEEHFLFLQSKERTKTWAMVIVIIVRELDKLKGKELGAAVYPKASR